MGGIVTVLDCDLDRGRLGRRYFPYCRERAGFSADEGERISRDCPEICAPRSVRHSGDLEISL